MKDLEKENQRLRRAISDLTLDNHCVSTTVRMAANLGFQTYLVTDATATFDRVGIDGRNRSAEEVHAAALSNLQEEFATLVDIEAVIAAARKLP